MLLSIKRQHVKMKVSKEDLMDCYLTNCSKFCLLLLVSGESAQDECCSVPLDAEAGGL